MHNGHLHNTLLRTHIIILKTVKQKPACIRVVVFCALSTFYLVKNKTAQCTQLHTFSSFIVVYFIYFPFFTRAVTSLLSPLFPASRAAMIDAAESDRFCLLLCFRLHPVFNPPPPLRPSHDVTDRAGESPFTHVTSLRMAPCCSSRILCISAWNTCLKVNISG